MPKVDITVLDALLQEVNLAGSEVYITETEPDSRAQAVSNALHSQTVVRTPATLAGDADTTRSYDDGPYNNIELDQIVGSQVPRFVAVCSPTLLLLVADTETPPSLPPGTVVDLGSWTHAVAAPINV